MSEQIRIRVGRGWPESERPGELYVACDRWTWCPTDDIARSLFEHAIKAITGKGKP